MDRYVVIGNPVAHSLSPEIHARFAQETGQVLEYSRLPVPPGEFAAHARRFFDEGGRGANVTLPFKEDAFRFATSASARATQAGAANVLSRSAGGIAADNTDGAGLVRDLTGNLGIGISGRRVLLLGAGGAARGVVGPLLALRPARLAIANRTRSRADALVAAFASLGAIEAMAIEALAAESHDVVINATSSSVRGEPLALPAGVLRANVFAYDMAYGPAARGFLAEAQAAGARASDGLGMLVEQAAESFLLWRGVRPPTAGILAELRARTP